MKGPKRFRARLARARLSLGGCRELRRAREEFSIFTPADESTEAPSFGSWL